MAIYARCMHQMSHNWWDPYIRGAHMWDIRSMNRMQEIILPNVVGLNPCSWYYFWGVPREWSEKLGAFIFQVF